MTKSEVIKMFGIIASLYTNAGRFAEADADMRDMWWEMLQDIPFDVAKRVVAQNAANSDYPPSIAQIRRAALQGAVEKRDTAEEAWALVLHALQNSAYNSVEEFAKLPEICKRCVGSPNVLKIWAVSEDENAVSVARAQFLNSYRALDKREQERAMLPPSVRDALDVAKRNKLLNEWNV